MKILINNNRKHIGGYAFTMIELVMAIIVLGILAALAIPRMERDIRQEAADNILSAIRYTQHMALTDNVTDPRDSDAFKRDKWQRAFWRFGIEGCSDTGIFYYVSSDKDYQGDIDTNEIVNDPANGLHLMGSNGAPCETQTQSGASPNIFLTKKYGITDGDISFINCDPVSGTSNGKYIGFDYLGRPHRGFAGGSGSSTPDYASIIHTDCTIVINFGSSGLEDINITIEKGTGHAYIGGQPNS